MFLASTTLIVHTSNKLKPFHNLSIVTETLVDNWLQETQKSLLSTQHNRTFLNTVHEEKLAPPLLYEMTVSVQVNLRRRPTPAMPAIHGSRDE